MARRILSYRQLTTLFSDGIDGFRFVVVRAIPVDDGRVLAEGEDITEQAAAWDEAVLRTHVKRGYVMAVPPASAERAPATPDAPDLRRMGKRPSKDELVRALRAAGAQVPPGATYDALMAMRRAVLMARAPAAPQPTA